MPIISQIGKRSAKVRILYASLYIILLLGALTMIYPLLLMLSGSVKSDADAWSINPYPEFWFNDLVLFHKYAESKYNSSTISAQTAWCKPVLSWRTVEPPAPVDSELIRDFRKWRKSIPFDNRVIGHAGSPGMLPKNLRSYRNWMSLEYKDNINAYNNAANQACSSWSYVNLPVEILGRYLNRRLTDGFRREINLWKEKIPETDIIVEGARGQYCLGYLYSVYTSRIDAYNNSHGTAYRNYSEVPFPDRVPAKAGLEREDWTKFVRKEIKLRYMRLDSSAEPAFRNFLSEQYKSLALFNKEHDTDYSNFDSIPFPACLDNAPFLRLDFEKFIKSKECPIESIRICSPDELFMDFLVKTHGKLPGKYPGLGAITAATDWADCQENKAAIRWEFSKRNYLQVIDYIVIHGNGMLNTFIYCGLAILAALIVNPIAAYALSRFRLPGTYKILLFCMATMAFPAEVTMIPSFLLLKRFPLWPIIFGLTATVIAFLILEKTLPKLKEGLRALLSLATGLLVGGIIVPALAPDVSSTSLLNNFAALILPGMANGYSIFLLKGFFDSQPKELYEAADIDGANEWIKFWMLTMNLSKPILAVIALGAFTHAYSAFMMALIIIPDQKMWTIMVWIFQLQSQAHQSVVYASIVIAAIPTFIIFVLCQNVIMRGIVVPTEK